MLQVDHRDPGSRARTGVLKLAHGEVRTPAFVPLATKGVVKGLEPREVAALGYDMVLGNTFHLFLAPGHELVAEQGGLHEFMRWSGPIVTDSGGFQVFSMGHGTVADEVKGRADRNPAHPDRAGAILSIEEQGVRFRSYIDGGERFMAPETSMEVQAALGSDIALAFDECTPFHVERDYTAALDRAHAPLARALPALAGRPRSRRTRSSTAIVQGGVYEDLRRESTRVVAPSDAGGVAIGGSLGADKAQMYEVVEWATDELERVAPGKPRHLLGIGEIDDLVRGVELGIDTFDCAMPTRLGRHGWRSCPTPSGAGASTSRRGAGSTRASRSWRAAPAPPARAATRAPTCTTCSRRAS